MIGCSGRTLPRIRFMVGLALTLAITGPAFGMLAQGLPTFNSRTGKNSRAFRSFWIMARFRINQ